MERIDGRGCMDLRPVEIDRGCNRYAEGSALIRWGNTHVLCTASVEEKVPQFLRGTGQGWVSAEYAMLPRSTHQRTQREISRGRPNARGQEIQRLIGRSLRASVDLEALGERTVWIDCDVLQADGGTRTAAITASFVALVDACRWLLDRSVVKGFPVVHQVAAVSAGLVDGEVLLDLCYEEDSAAQVDCNVVMAEDGRFVELQATGEDALFPRQTFDRMLSAAEEGIRRLHRLQLEVLGVASFEELVGR
ncbi:ribonuclease PH [Thermanaerovibrio velox DSM 12556]|uniref:Ribonuclease PH n=1 Tax=Thermanaerovibrio velox DSM 12556 TaxID=926567 RepID=H0UNS5_9BACT|nr:ribonuclease PH [Thermanaerovibrio velox]EHM09411.1 ribonuclease PH [Thermanaerovibrio velox DSM 12556]